MKKTLLLLLAVFFTGAVSAQNLVNFTVDAGDDQDLNCETGPCTDIQPDFVQTYNPTVDHAYNVASLPFDPVPTFNPTGLANDDTYSDLIDLPFNFTFYGETYDQVIVGGNGDIVFDPVYANAGNSWPINADDLVPDPDLGGNFLGPTPAIFGAFHDMDVSVDGAVQYEVTGTAPFRAFVVNYNVAQFDCNDLYTVQQIVLHETSNYIDVYITDKPVCTTWNNGLAVIGIQNAGGTLGVSPPGRNTGVWEADMEAWRFKPVADPDAANFDLTVTDESGNVITVTDPDTYSINVCLDEGVNSQDYEVTVTYTDGDGNPFDVSDSVTINYNEQDLIGNLDDVLLCDGSPGVDLNATPNDSSLDPTLLSYSWMDEDGNEVGTSAIYNASQSGIYTVEVTYGSCTEMFSSNVVFGDAPDINLGADFTSCLAENVVLDATPSNFTAAESSFEWFFNNSPLSDVGATLNVDELGTYSVTVTGPNGCESTDSITISQGNNLVVDLGGNVSICETENQSITLNSTVTGNEDENLTYSWALNGSEVGSSETLTNVNQSGLYTLTVSNGVCTGSASIQVDNFCIPEGISPNGDGTNDCMDLTFLSDRTGIASMEFFNRYGTSIFKLNNYTNQWCGQTDDGEDLPTGTYYYVIKFNGEDEIYGAVKTGWVYVAREVN